MGQQAAHQGGAIPYEVDQPRLERNAYSAGCLAVTVVVCAYSKLRWQQTRAALESVLAQNPGPGQILLVVDHNADLAELARHEFRKVAVLESAGPPGLSGARNTGLLAATQPITVFLDDDAEARPGWLASLVGPFRYPAVVATGGNVQPKWPGFRPCWLPPAFYWVVGCSYLGLPGSTAAIRNPIGANMSLRTDLAIAVGGFSSLIGRVGSNTRGGEETELAIRLTARQPGSVILYVPGATVDHSVGRERLRIGYFMRRCWHEGRSKATVVRLVGASVGLRCERLHIAAVIPAALLRDLRSCVTGDMSGCLRVAVSLAGLAAALTGYLTGRVSLAGRSARLGD
jgi:hypothetical protein